MKEQSVFKINAATARRSNPLAILSGAERWALYLVMTALPGLNIFIWFGFPWSLAFEVVVWVPQQRFFDALDLGKTLPYQNL